MNEIILPNDVMMGGIAALLSEGREVRFTPKGVSMRPFIEGGRDSVILKKRTDYDIGDIVLVKLVNGCYLLHRIIEKSGEKLTLMGDGNLKGTESALASDVIGMVTGIVKPNGKCVRPKKGRLWFRLLPFRSRLLWIYRKKLKFGI